ncbi:ABC transporter ATP-binding protein [Lysinibacillus alkalisoli]|uniref:ABC transporter ATP-binding protein n=1 Tax=Lysinibacillus alkalisoli TaxID=1911548 RepID=A0A917G0N0_9BACI|nr:ABC transporter ATP-binding protein [Lysinibacillus alkalisoli]GGG16503.1 ABC transporter ATP-binding protein [Lysinibacillus alkalisoli]
MLEIKALHQSFGEVDVLRDVTFTVNEGEFVAILGPSGSGKSTLFQLIGGILAPKSGAILLHQRPINGEKGHMSYMPQQASLLPWRTVLQNVVLGQEIQGKANKEEAKQWLARVGLASFEEAYPIELSGGMKQRVTFIRALLSDRELLCLDEPFSALDEFTRLEMQTWLLSVWEKHRRSVLFVTHSIEEAIYLADKIVVLTKRPATVKQVINVPFARPRQEALLATTEFIALKQQLFTLIKEEKA